jgi:(2Fe-2S) ferredoxin
VVAAVQRALLARGAIDVLVTNSGCLGPCFDGPNAVVYPDGAWYSGLADSDANALADHLIDGVILAEKLSQRPGVESDSLPTAVSTARGDSGDSGATG